jgi:hypothetical protein
VSSSSTGMTTTTEPDPYRNPSYPPRSHYSERSHLDEALRNCDQRLESARQKLNSLANHADKARLLLLFHQLQGACDQVAEAVRRLPLETGGLYHEDHERFHNAMDASERTWRRWESAAGG